VSVAAIQVTGLSKRYRIGARQQYRTFREALTSAVLSPWRRLKALGRSSFREEDSIWALRDVSFEVQLGEVLGVIGPNGAGKTTLLKVLSRITRPTEGRAVLHGRVASLLEVGTGFHPELTGRENIYLSSAILGMRKAEIDARFDEIVEFSGVERFLDTPVKRYSTGMRVRLGFAVSAHLEPEILLVDEILAVGDAAFKRKSLGKMGELGRGGRAVVFVSHDLAAIRHLCTSCIALRDGRIIAAGDPARTVKAYLNAVAPGSEHGGGFCFDVPRPDPLPEAYVTRVEVVDEAGRPVTRLATGDRFRARIHFRCEQAGRYAPRLSIHTLDGTPLVGYSTELTGGFHLDCKPGEHSVDCLFPELPLAAGRYRIGAALAVPRIRMIHNAEFVGLFDVGPSDVFGTGKPMVRDKCLMVVSHCWEIPPGQAGMKAVK